jgi:hypothetical protein
MSESDLSDSLYDIDVPGVTNFSVNFVYNFFDRTERVPPVVSNPSIELGKKPRYVLLTWKLDSDKVYNGTAPATITNSRILSEDDLVNAGYVAHTFSDASHMIQGADDLESSSNLISSTGLSLSAMSNIVLQELVKPSGVLTDDQRAQLDNVKKAHESLFSLPMNNLGVTFYDKNNRPIPASSDSEILRSVSDALSLSVKVSNEVIPDFFKLSPEKEAASNLALLNYASSLERKRYDKTLSVTPAGRTDATVTNQVVGYKIDRYSVTNDNYKKEKTYFIENPSTTLFVDEEVLYGATYLYAIRAVSVVDVFVDDTATLVKTFVSSHPSSRRISCFEHKPPPPPSQLNFQYDYVKNNLVISWMMPVNSQQDIKQFQVFRRSSIKHPFELIKQYGFDDSIVGPQDKKYTTGEKIDANDLKKAESLGLSELVASYDSGTVNHHVDEDFKIDTEFFQDEPDYIYSVASVDAHGMISSYSEQVRATFDQYKNQLVLERIAESGAPRQHPNLTLVSSPFKDAIVTQDGGSGQTRKMTVFFSPDCITLKNNLGKEVPIVSTKTSANDSFYILQLINLDNQKVQQIRMEVEE